MTEKRLVIRNLVAGYGDLPVLHSVSMELEAGGSVAVLGANGAGKTTLLRTLGGELKVDSGSILLDDEEVPAEPNWKRVRRGLVLAPEGHPIISELSVEENLQLGSVRFWPRRHRKVLAEVLPEVFDLFPKLAARRNQIAGSLSGGEQQMLSLARSLLAKPRVLLMDEPSLGLAPVVVEAIVEAAGALRDRGLSFVLAEQNSDVAQALCEYVYILRLGELVMQGPSGSFGVEELRTAYFGELPAGDDELTADTNG